MSAIQVVMSRFRLSARLRQLTATLRRLCRHQPVPACEEVPGQESVPEPALYAEPADAEEKFAAWEEERGRKLDRADECARQGLRLLARGVLLRAAVTCEDRGDVATAGELRQQAHEAAGPNSNELHLGASWVFPH